MSTKPGGKEPATISAPYRAAGPRAGSAAPGHGLARRTRREARIDDRARRLIEAIRGTRRRARRHRGLPARLFALHQGGPGADGAGRGAAARARMRPPPTALIEDKLAAGRLVAADTSSRTPSWSRPRPGRSASRRASSSPARRRRASSTACSSGSACLTVRTATRQAMRLLGTHFVLGQTIEEALTRAGSHREFRYSFDMLGEGARTAADAARYFEAYADAIAARSAAPPATRRCRARPGISVKLSALHPRYEAVSAASA